MPFVQRVTALRLVLLIALVTTLASPRGVNARHADAPAAPLAPRWLNGGLVRTQVINCASIIFGSPYSEQGLGAYVSQLVDPDLSQPQPNQTYYLRVYIAATGNPCPVQLASVEFELPPNTAYDSSASPFCFHNQGPGTGNTSTCGMIQGTNEGRLWVRSTDPSGFWWFRQGYTLDVRIPVRSSAPFSAQRAGARLQIADGNSSPTLSPFVNAYVFPGTGSGGSAGGGTGGNPTTNPPTFAFDSPSTISITHNNAVPQGYLYTPALSGSLYFDIGLSPGSYVATVGPRTLPAGSWFNTVNLNSTLSPNTTYYWRFRFMGSNGTPYVSPEQSFTTLAADARVVGTGTPASCTGQGVLDAIRSAPNITVTFDCGPLPVTIPVGMYDYDGTSLAGIIVDSGKKVIDGGNKVAFESAWRSVFGLQAGELTLKNMTISGVVPSRGGYAVSTSGGQLTLDGVRVINNHSEPGAPGAVLVRDASAVISGSQFISNSAALDGGALYAVRSSVYIYHSDFSHNSAAGNGGAIAAMPGSASQRNSLVRIERSLFYSNTAGLDGGAIHMPSTETGNQVIYSTIDSNRANRYAGAISGRGLLTNLTIHANSSGMVNCAPDDNGDGNPDYFCAGGAVEHYDALTLSDVILKANAPGNCGVDQSVPDPYALGTFRGNLSSDGSCTSFLNHSSDLHNSNQPLGPLENSGGRTRTRAITVNSPAYNTASIASTSDRDQRGFAMFGPPDRGAFELQANEIPIIGATPSATPVTPTATRTATPGPGTPSATPGVALNRKVHLPLLRR